jgi:acetolactate synthase-1/2/3 large subunit
MTVSDYTIDYLIRKGIDDVFCYPGSTLGFFLESLRKRQGAISAHLNYHEQASAYAACGYSLTAGKPAVCLVMQGPGVTNAVSGITNAYLDSIPVVFITAQVHTSQFKGESRIRQKGVQEVDTLAIVKPVTKYAKTILNAEDFPYELEKAWQIAISGRKGPVLLDVPVDVSRTEITQEGIERSKEIDILSKYNTQFDNNKIDGLVQEIITRINSASKPLMFVGAGIRQMNFVGEFKKFIDAAKLPFVTSLLAQDLYTQSPYFAGFIGNFGSEAAIEITNRADLIVALGTRLSNRSIAEGNRVFAPNAKLIRVDIDEDELTRKIKPSERQMVSDLGKVISRLSVAGQNTNDFSLWQNECTELRLNTIDECHSKTLEQLTDFMRNLPGDSIFTVGRGQAKAMITRALAQSRAGQRTLFTGGLGAMGFALPAAIGAYHASKKPVYCLTGDGCMQMNIQELNYIGRHKIPITAIILNNHRLGQITLFQDKNFDSKYFVSTEDSGYHAPDYKAIAASYGIKYANELHENSGVPEIIDIEMD